MGGRSLGWRTMARLNSSPCTAPTAVRRSPGPRRRRSPTSRWLGTSLPVWAAGSPVHGRWTSARARGQQAMPFASSAPRWSPSTWSTTWWRTTWLSAGTPSSGTSNTCLWSRASSMWSWRRSCSTTWPTRPEPCVSSDESRAVAALSSPLCSAPSVRRPRRRWTRRLPPSDGCRRTGTTRFAQRADRLGTVDQMTTVAHDAGLGHGQRPVGGGGPRSSGARAGGPLPARPTPGPRVRRSAAGRRTS